MIMIAMFKDADNQKIIRLVDECSKEDSVREIEYEELVEQIKDKKIKVKNIRVYNNRLLGLQRSLKYYRYIDSEHVVITCQYKDNKGNIVGYGISNQDGVKQDLSVDETKEVVEKGLALNALIVNNEVVPDGYAFRTIKTEEKTGIFRYEEERAVVLDIIDRLNKVVEQRGGITCKNFTGDMDALKKVGTNKEFSWEDKVVVFKLKDKIIISIKCRELKDGEVDKYMYYVYNLKSLVVERSGSEGYGWYYGELYYEKEEVLGKEIEKGNVGLMVDNTLYEYRWGSYKYLSREERVQKASTVIKIG